MLANTEIYFKHYQESVVYNPNFSLNYSHCPGLPSCFFLIIACKSQEEERTTVSEQASHAGRLCREATCQRHVFQNCLWRMGSCTYSAYAFPQWQMKGWLISSRTILTNPSFEIVLVNCLSGYVSVWTGLWLEEDQSRSLYLAPMQTSRFWLMLHPSMHCRLRLLWM